MKKFASEIFKCTRPGKLDVDEAPHIERCVHPGIQDKYNLTPKTSPIDFSDMLPPITKIIRVKNKCCPFINWHNEKH